MTTADKDDWAEAIQWCPTLNKNAYKGSEVVYRELIPSFPICLWYVGNSIQAPEDNTLRQHSQELFKSSRQLDCHLWPPEDFSSLFLNLVETGMISIAVRGWSRPNIRSKPQIFWSLEVTFCFSLSWFSFTTHVPTDGLRSCSLLLFISLKSILSL